MEVISLISGEGLREQQGNSNVTGWCECEVNIKTLGDSHRIIIGDYLRRDAVVKEFMK